MPQADPGPLVMTHVREGVSVWIDTHDNLKVGDDIRLEWGGQTLGDFVIGTNPMPAIEIPVLPALLMLEDYGKSTSGDKPTVVSYQVVRQGRLFGPESDTFNVNFETVLPWPDPWPPIDWPDPVHPKLLAGVVKNFDGTRTNELTRADKGQDAKFEFTWYDDVVDGHIIDFFWNGARVVEAQIVFDITQTGHVPGGQFEVAVPWQYIRDGGNGNQVPVHYQVTGSGLVNDLFSEPTVVNVNAIAVELPAGSFPSFVHQPVPAYPGCGSLEDDGALRVAIPDLTGVLNNGDKINVVFTPKHLSKGWAQVTSPSGHCMHCLFQAAEGTVFIEQASDTDIEQRLEQGRITQHCHDDQPHFTEVSFDVAHQLQAIGGSAVGHRVVT